MLLKARSSIVGVYIDILLMVGFFCVFVVCCCVILLCVVYVCVVSWCVLWLMVSVKVLILCD